MTRVVKRIPPEPDAVIALAERLKTARSLVADLEQQWEQLFQPDDKEREDDEVSDNGAERTPIAERIVVALNERFLDSFTSDEVATLVGAKSSSVASVLSRLVREQKIEKRGFSAYGSTVRITVPEAEIAQEKNQEATEAAS